MSFNIITIEREFASGGKEIGDMTAKGLGIPCYGSEILEMAAGRTGVTVDQVRDFEENATNSLLHSIVSITKPSLANYAGMPSSDAISVVQANIIEDIANRENCVIIGRGAGYVLRERNDVLRVFIHADMDFRRKRAVDTYGADPQKPDTVIKKTDKRRANFYKALSGKPWGEAADFHITLDSGRLGLETCAALICRAVRP